MEETWWCKGQKKRKKSQEKVKKKKYIERKGSREAGLCMSHEDVIVSNVTIKKLRGTIHLIWVLGCKCFSSYLWKSFILPTKGQKKSNCIIYTKNIQASASSSGSITWEKKRKKNICSFFLSPKTSPEAITQRCLLLLNKHLECVLSVFSCSHTVRTPHQGSRWVRETASANPVMFLQKNCLSNSKKGCDATKSPLWSHLPKTFKQFEHLYHIKMFNSRLY